MLNHEKLKKSITEDIFKSYTRQGFGKLLKSEIDLIMFDFSLKLIFAKSKPEYFEKDELNYFLLNKQDIYNLSKELKITETKVKSYIEQTGLVKSLISNEELALQSFKALFQKQTQDQELMRNGKLRCYIPNKLLKSFIESKIDMSGSIPNYSFNNDILIFDFFIIFTIFGTSDEAIKSWIRKQNKLVNDKETSDTVKTILRKEFSKKDFSVEMSKKILAKFIGKGSDVLVDSVIEMIERDK